MHLLVLAVEPDESNSENRCPKCSLAHYAHKCERIGKVRERSSDARSMDLGVPVCRNERCKNG